MRLLFFTPYYFPALGYGGPTTSLATLCEGLVQQGAQVTVLTTNANRPDKLSVRMGEPLDVNGVHVWYFPLSFNGLGAFYSLEQMAAFRKQVGFYDLLHIFTLWSPVIAEIMRICRTRGKPYLSTINGQLYPWALRQKGLKKRIFLTAYGLRFLEQASGVHCTEPGEAAAVRSLAPKARAFVVPNGVKIDDYQGKMSRRRFRQELGIPDAARVLLFLGRLHHNKRPDIAIQVVAGLADSGIHLILAGQDEQGLSQRLLALADQSGCLERVHIIGLVNANDVHQLLNETDLLLMPSEVNENFGMSALEALSAGVPVLVSEGVPVGRWAAEVGAGKFVPCDPGEFTRVARELLANPDGLVEMGRRGQLLAREKFDHHVVAAQMLAQYQAILDVGRPIKKIFI